MNDDWWSSNQIKVTQHTHIIFVSTALQFTMRWTKHPNNGNCTLYTKPSNGDWSHSHWYADDSSSRQDDCRIRYCRYLCVKNLKSDRQWGYRGTRKTTLVCEFFSDWPSVIFDRMMHENECYYKKAAQTDGTGQRKDKKMILNKARQCERLVVCFDRFKWLNILDEKDCLQWNNVYGKL